MAVARSRKLQILAALALTNLVSYAARNALFSVVKPLEQQFAIDDAQVGLLQTMFMLSHALATLPFGWAGDRYDRRRVIIVGIVVASVAGAAGAIGHSYWSLAVSRGLVGLGTAAVVPVANSILGEIFDGPSKASRMAIFNLGLFLGGVAGFAAGSAVGFPTVVLVVAVPGIALAGWLAALPVPVRPEPPPSSSLVGTLAPFVGVFIANARALLRIRTLRWVMVSTTAMAFATGGLAAWLKEFLIREKGLTEVQANLLLGLGLAGGVAGVLAGGRIADRLRRTRVNGRLWAIALGMTLTIPCAVLSIHLPNAPALYAIGVATLFFISWYHAPMAASVDDLAPEGHSATAQSLVIFTMHMVGTAPASWVLGEVSKHRNLTLAMWVPIFAIGVAAVAMAIATRSFAADHARARSGTRAA
jgi:MFS family permease